MSDSTLIALHGRDTLDLLHRISTQALHDLGAGETRMACLCDFRGRLQHRFWIARDAHEVVWLARPDASAPSLLTALDRSIFREDVRVVDHSDAFAVVLSPDSRIGSGALVMGAASPLRMRATSGPELAVIGPGALDARDVVQMDERARIAVGIAAQGHEIFEDYTPFEVNLADAVHLDKGCFTGQETLQRLVTHDSVRRRLFAVRGAGVSPVVPGELRFGDERVGRLTSAAVEDGGWIGLAVMRHDLDLSRTLALADGGAVAEAWPLPLARPLGRPWAAVD